MEQDNKTRFCPMCLMVAIIIIVALVTIGAIFYWNKYGNKSRPIVCTQEAMMCSDGSYVSRTGPNCDFTKCPSVNNEITDWETLIPDIKIVLQQAYPEMISYENQIVINEKADITGDGIQEALVTISHGATTDLLVLMRIENNKPVIAKLKQKDGIISVPDLSSGAGGAGRYGSDTKLLENEKAISFNRYTAYGDNNDSCISDVYQWNSATKLFEYNASLSKNSTDDYCKSICDGIGREPTMSEYFRKICP